MNPQFDLAYNNRGYAYTCKKLANKAIEDFNKAIELNPRYEIAYNGRGNAYRNKKEYAKAIEDFNKAIELNPQYAWAYMLVQASRAVARGPVARVVAGMADATRTSGRPRKRDCSSTSTRAASPPRPWTRRRAASLPGRRTSRWHWWRSNFRGWTPGRPRAASRAIWAWRRFMSGERRSSAPNTSAGPRRSSRARIASRSAPPLR